MSSSRRARAREEARRALNEISMLESRPSRGVRGRLRDLERRVQGGGPVSAADVNLAKSVRADVVRRTTERYLERDRRGG